MAEVNIFPITTHSEIEGCISLQKEVWGLDDKGVTSPITLKALSMLEPEMSVFRGASVDGDLVGLVLAMPSIQPATAYGHMLGVKKEYRKLGIGVMLHEHMLTMLKEKGMTTYTFTYEPLESKLGHMYLNRAGASAYLYQEEYFNVECERHKNLPLDRLLATIDLKTNFKPKKVESLSEALGAYPVVTPEFLPKSPRVLVAIPANLQAAKTADFNAVLKSRMDTRAVFSEYINNRKYSVDRLVSGFTAGERRSYYVLEGGADE